MLFYPTGIRHKVREDIPRVGVLFRKIGSWEARKIGKKKFDKKSCLFFLTSHLLIFPLFGRTYPRVGVLSSTLSHKYCSWCWQYKKQSNYFHLTHFIGTGKSEIVKHEYRNSKQIQMTKIQMTKTKKQLTTHRIYLFWILKI